jgi:hypothetical protein
LLPASPIITRQAKSSLQRLLLLSDQIRRDKISKVFHDKAARGAVIDYLATKSDDPSVSWLKCFEYCNRKSQFQCEFEHQECFTQSIYYKSKLEKNAERQRNLERAQSFAPSSEQKYIWNLIQAVDPLKKLLILCQLRNVMWQNFGNDDPETPRGLAGGSQIGVLNVLRTHNRGEKLSQMHFTGSGTGNLINNNVRLLTLLT